MNIHSKGPGKGLSNFAPRPFAFRGVDCASMEGLLQSLKFDKPPVQRMMCGLVGLNAKRRGQRRNKAWQRVQTLWWDGVAMDRHGGEYQAFLDEAYRALFFGNDKAGAALLATGTATLRHSIGSSDPSKTVLTEREFVTLLTKIRDELRSGAKTE